MSDKVGVEAGRTPDGCVLDVRVEHPGLARISFMQRFRLLAVGGWLLNQQATGR